MTESKFKSCGMSELVILSHLTKVISASPEEIRQVTGLSSDTVKRSVGVLVDRGLITRCQNAEVYFATGYGGVEILEYMRHLKDRR